jgi:DNA ligase-1
MLAGKVSDVNKLRYPVLASNKLDGVRAFIHNGAVFSRNFKPIPNVHVQKLFASLPAGTDGELILGEPTAPDAYRKTVSAVMCSENPEGANVVFHVFDIMEEATPFWQRHHHLHDAVQVNIVKNWMVKSPEALLEMESEALKAGYEGLMVRDPNGPYKHGRSTEKEGWLLKLKRFEDSEAVVYGYVPLMHNDNEAMEDELGHTKRSTAKAGLVAQEMLGKFLVKDIKTGVEFECGTGLGLTQELRRQLWNERDTLAGRIIKYKFFPSGGKDKPRFPIWLGWRSPLDMDTK